MPARVLVVDDDRDIRDCVRMILEDEGYDVSDVSSGEAALEALRATRHDLVLLDYKMPGMNAEELLSLARAEDLVHCPVLLLTADRDPESLAARAGTDAVLEKPFSLDELLALVRVTLAPG